MLIVKFLSLSGFSYAYVAETQSTNLHKNKADISIKNEKTTPTPIIHNSVGDKSVEIENEPVQETSGKTVKTINVEPNYRKPKPIILPEHDEASTKAANPYRPDQETSGKPVRVKPNSGKPEPVILPVNDEITTETANLIVNGNGKGSQEGRTIENSPDTNAEVESKGIHR